MFHSIEKNKISRELEDETPRQSIKSSSFFFLNYHALKWPNEIPGDNLTHPVPKEIHVPILSSLGSHYRITLITNNLGALFSSNACPKSQISPKKTENPMSQACVNEEMESLALVTQQ